MPILGRALLVPLAVLATTWGACGGGSGEAHPDTEVEFTASQDGVRVSEAAFRTLRDRLSPYQVDILDDRVLTFAEYEAAFLASRQCVLDLGYTITEEHPPSMFSVGGFGLFHPRPDEATKRGAEDCIVTYRGELQRIWGRVHAPTEQQLQEARDSMGACLRELDPSGAPEHPTEHDLANFLKVGGEERALHWAACLDETEDEFGFPAL